MPSTFTSSLLVEKQAAGENLNTWGDTRLNVALDQVDAAVGKVETHTLTANKSLTYTNATVTDGSALVHRFLSASDGAYTFTLGGYARLYLFVNDSGFDQTIACSGGGTSVTVRDGERVLVHCDGVNNRRIDIEALSNVDISGTLTVGGAASFAAIPTIPTTTPTASNQAVSKQYADALAISGLIDVPTLVGNALKVVRVNSAETLLEFVGLVEAINAATALTRETTGRAVTSGEAIYADISSNQTFTLPSSPSASDRVIFVTGRNVGTNTLTIARNGETIGGAAADLEITSFGLKYTLEYINGGWEVYQG